VATAAGEAGVGRGEGEGGVVMRRIRHGAILFFRKINTLKFIYMNLYIYIYIYINIHIYMCVCNIYIYIYICIYTYMLL